jgi:hypothetical protein
MDSRKRVRIRRSIPGMQRTMPVTTDTTHHTRAFREARRAPP